MLCFLKYLEASLAVKALQIKSASGFQDTLHACNSVSNFIPLPCFAFSTCLNGKRTNLLHRILSIKDSEEDV